MINCDKMTLPGSSFHSSPAAAYLPLLASCSVLCSSLRIEKPQTLSDSRPHDDSLIRVVTGARSGRCGHPFTRPLVASRGALLPPSLLALTGRPPPLPTGEAVIMKDALRAITSSGAFWVVSQCLMQQRRAVRYNGPRGA